MKKYILVLASIVLLTDIFVCMVKYNQTADNAKTYFANLIEQQRIVAQKQVDSIFTHKHTDVFPIYSRCKPHYIIGSIKNQIVVCLRILWMLHIRNLNYLLT